MPRVKKSKSKSKARKPAAKRAASSAKKAKASSTQRRPIEIYYWPTPNGHKVTMMCEECGLPYTIKPVNIARGDQFKPEFLKISRTTACPRSSIPRGQAAVRSRCRIRRDPPVSRTQDGEVLSYGRA